MHPGPQTEALLPPAPPGGRLDRALDRLALLAARSFGVPFAGITTFAASPISARVAALPAVVEPVLETFVDRVRTTGRPLLAEETPLLHAPSPHEPVSWFLAGAPFRPSSIEADEPAGVIWIAAPRPYTVPDDARALLASLAAAAADALELHHHRKAVARPERPGLVRDVPQASSEPRDLLRDTPGCARAERRRPQSTQRFRTAFQLNPVAASILTLPEGRFVDVNEPYERLTGYDRSHLLDRLIQDTGLLPDLERWTTLARQIHTEDEVSNVELGMRTRSGDRRTVLTSFQAIEVDDVPCALALSIDLTDVIDIQRQLEASKTRWQLLVECHPDPIVVSVDETVVYTNPATAALLGASYVEEINGVSFFDILPPTYHAPLQSRLASLKRGERVGMMEYPICTLTGETRHVEAAGVGIDYGGQPAVLTVARDITDRKRIEQALQEAQGLLAATIDALPAHIAVLDEHGTIIMTNAAWRRFAEANGGRPAATGVGVNYLAVCAAADGAGSAGAAPVHEALQALLAGDREAFSLEYACPSPDEERWFILRANRFVVADTVYVVTAHEDITARKRAAQDLQQREAMNRALLDGIPDAVLRVRASGLVLDARLPAHLPLPFGATDARNRYVQELLPEIYSIVLLDHLDECIRTGTPQEWTHLSGEGDHLVAFEARFVPYLPQEAVVMIRDVRQEQRLTMEVVEARAREQRRIGQDLHDGLGQQLAGISFLSGSLLRKVRTAAPDCVALAQQIQTETHRAIDQSASLARGLNPVDLPDGWVAALDELAHRTEEVYGISCTVEVQGEVKIKDSAVAYHLYRITQETVHNAIKHADPQHIRISMTSDADHLLLVIEDDGPGFDTTAVHGEGMGLHTMQYRANLIGASLQLRSRPGTGTTIRCHVPQSGPPPLPRP